MFFRNQQQMSNFASRSKSTRKVSFVQISTSRPHQPNLYRFANEKCGSYLKQLIDSSKISQDGYKPLFRASQIQPSNSLYKKTKKIPIIPIFKSKQTLNQKSANAQRKFVSYKIRSKTVVTKERRTKQYGNCLPLQQGDCGQREADTNQTIDRMRMLKERQQRRRIKQNNQKYKQNLKRQDLLIKNKSQVKVKDIFKLHACSYSGLSIPISISQNINKPQMSRISFKIISCDENNNIIPYKSNPTTKRIKSTSNSQNKKLKNKVRIASTHDQNYKTLQMFTPQDSQFLKNFNHLRFNSKGMNVKQKKQVFKQQHTDLFKIIMSQNFLNMSKKISNQKKDKSKNILKTSNYKVRNCINVIDNSLLSRQFLNQTKKMKTHSTLQSQFLTKN